MNVALDIEASFCRSVDYNSMVTARGGPNKTKTPFNSSILIASPLLELKMLDLTGKVALVTGGSRGIGAAVALKLAQQGADVHVHYSSSPIEAQKVAESIIQLGRKADIIQSDLSTTSCATEIMEAVMESEFGGGRLDILSFESRNYG